MMEGRWRSPLDALPDPRPGDLDAPFWQGCERHRLLFPRCSGTRRWLHPSLPLAGPEEGDVEWVEASGPALVFTHARVWYAAHESVTTALPYDVVVVRFPSCGDVRLLSNLIGCETEAVPIESPVRLVWGRTEGGRYVPRFALRRSSP